MDSLYQLFEQPYRVQQESSSSHDLNSYFFNQQPTFQQEEFKLYQNFSDDQLQESDLLNQILKSDTTQSFQNISQAKGSQFKQPPTYQVEAMYQQKKVSFNKTKKIKKESVKEKPAKKYYDTHNMLTPVMKIHLKYICKRYDGLYTIKTMKNLLQKFKMSSKNQNLEEMTDNPTSSKETKNSANMNQFNSIYKIDELRGILNQFFEQKILYRQLMMARINQNSRKAFFENINVFENNFRKKEFNVTNLKAQLKNKKCRSNSTQHLLNQI